MHVLMSLRPKTDTCKHIWVKVYFSDLSLVNAQQLHLHEGTCLPPTKAERWKCKLSKLSNNKYNNTHCIFLVRMAAPQVADQSLHSLQAHCTVWHVHMVFLVSFSGCSSQVCGRPEQFFWGTTISVVWMDRVLSANPHVADQSDHAFQVHLTDLHGPKNNSQNNDNVSKMKKILVH